MARADLFNYADLDKWMEAVSESLKQTLLFRTHDDGAGSATDSPLFRLKPTQVVAYDLFTVSRHIAEDANEGAAASHNLIGGATVDLDGEVELLTTLSGSTGSLQADTNMLSLRDIAPSGERGVGVQYDASGGTITNDNTMPGVWHILLSLDSFGESPEVEIEAHTHEDSNEGGTLGRLIWEKTDISFAGSISSSSPYVVFSLNAHAFFPMIHTVPFSGGLTAYICGHNVDAADPLSPRLGLFYPFGVGSTTYDIDSRSIDGG